MAAWFAPLLARLATGVAATQSGGGAAAKTLAAAAKDSVKLVRKEAANPAWQKLWGPGTKSNPITPQLVPKEELRGRELKTVGHLVGLGVAAEAARRGLEWFARHQVENAAELMRFNGAIAKSVLQLQRQEFLLKFRTAAATSGSTKTLSESVQGMNESLQPIKELSTNMKNIAGALGAEIVSALASLSNTLLRPLNEIVKWFTGANKSSEQLPVFDFFRDMAAGDFITMKERESPPPSPWAIQKKVLSFQWPSAWRMAEERAAKTARPSKD